MLLHGYIQCGILYNLPTLPNTPFALIEREFVLGGSSDFPRGTIKGDGSFGPIQVGGVFWWGFP